MYNFIAEPFTENNRTYIAIPFNVWEKGKRGTVPARAKVNGKIFECKLLPKGNGNYLLPIPKAIATTLSGNTDVTLEFIL